MLKLLSNVSTNSTGTAVATVSPQSVQAVVVCWATSFGAGTVTVTFSPDAGTTWIGFPTAVTFTANGSANITLPPGIQVHAALAGSTAASGVNCRILF